MKSITDRMSNEEYSKYVESKTPRSQILKNCTKAFFIGGAICAFGQVLLNLYSFLGVSEEDSFTLVSITLIFLGTLLTGLNIYPRIAKHGGAGTLVPVTGFANAVAAPALEAKTQGYITGVGSEIFKIAGPVILFGVLSSAICGTLYFFIA